MSNQDSWLLHLLVLVPNAGQGLDGPILCLHEPGVGASLKAVPGGLSLPHPCPGPDALVAFGEGTGPSQESSLSSWLAQLEKHVALDLRVMNSSPTLGVEITKKINK